MSDTILLLVKSTSCPACQVLETLQNDMIEKIKKYHPNLKVESIVLKNKDISQLDERYNVVIKKYIPRFPFIALIKGNEWRDSLKNIKQEYKFHGIDIFGKVWFYRNGELITEQDTNGFTYRNMNHVEKWAKEAFTGRKVALSTKNSFDQAINEKLVNPLPSLGYTNSNNNQPVHNLSGDECPNIIFKPRKMD